MNEPTKYRSSGLIKNYKSSTPERRWELVYGPKDRFYLTTREKDMFVGEVSKGKDVIVLDEIVLTRFFKFLIPVAPMKSSEPLPVDEYRLDPEERKKSLEALNKTRKKLVEKFGFHNLEK